MKIKVKYRNKIINEPLCLSSIFLFLFLFLSFFSYNAVAQNLEWVSKDSMPFPRMEFGTAVVNGKIYLFGGYSGSVLSRVDEYDPATGIWREMADMPTPRRLMAGAAINGKIYAIGGWNFTGLSTSECDATFSFATEEYDPQTDNWTTKADFPVPPPFGSCVESISIGASGANGKIYVFISHTQIKGESATYEFDPISNVWDTTKSPVPFSHTRYSAANWNDKIYVLGTRGAELAEYDPVNDLWVHMPSTCPGRLDMELAANSTGLYAIGGREYYSTDVSIIGYYDPSANIEYFDPSANNGWKFISALPTPRFSLGTATVNNSIYTLGGVGVGGRILSSVEQGDIPILSWPMFMPAILGDQQ